MKAERETVTYILVMDNKNIGETMFSGYRPPRPPYDLVGGYGSLQYFISRMKHWWAPWRLDHNMEQDCVKRDVLLAQ